ncbi:MAG: TAXI family TRAP transporter solute-binding subunit [Gammaproteobacteria bacterium]|nr:TAXI family TRAP transporter solute-binding subunit [Gammaproteobacteria bacterium]MDH3413722.1 TAXI family TRAP transporter solute-binding subunit [Gammaproteobacteria bacterium]
MKSVTMKTALILALGIGVGAVVSAQDKINIAWGGSNPGGVMYYMVGTAGTIISEKLPQYNITQVTTGGSTENAKRIIKGELDMGIVYGAHVFMSQKPEGPFKNGPKGTMFRGVAKAYKGPTYFVTLPDSGISTISNLKGKKVALGPPGSGTVFNCSNILRAVGMLEDINASMMTFADAGRALGNGQIDALCQSSAPAAAVKELAETRGAVVLPYSDEEMQKITSTYPFYNKGTMPATTYKGVPAVDLPFLTVYWVAHERVPAMAVQDILELVYQPEIKKRLAAGHKAWAQMEPDTKNFEALGVPMHPGAVAYYKSKGLWGN